MTLSMDLPENDDVQLTEQNFRNVCRLCLHADEEFINVFEGMEQNPSKRPLADRVYDLYQIKLLKDDGLPTNICHRCLYNTELFSEFRDGVHQNEHKLQDFVMSLASRSIDVEVTPTEWHLDDILHDQHESSDFYQNNVVVIDPLKCYESSDEECNTEEIEQPEVVNESLPPIPLPENCGGFMKKSTNISSGESKPLRNVFFCKHCEAAFAKRDDCETHEINNHDPITPNVCNFCPFRCDSQPDFISHIKQFHDAERPYFCTQCNKNFGRRADLRKHAVSHTGIRPFSCPVCGKTFSRKTNVTNHMKVHEGKKSTTPNQKSPTKSKNPFAPASSANFAYQPMSAEGFPHQQFLSAEQLSPSKPENMIYSKCTVKSDPNTIPKLKLKLTKPFQSPTSPRFGCSTCKKSFKTKRDLDRHSQIHTGMKFQCSVCSKGFARRDKLVRHEKIHTNRNKTAALPESAFLVENLKRGSHSHFLSENKSSPAAAAFIEKQTFKPDSFRPQFYAEYDLSETNN